MTFLSHVGNLALNTSTGNQAETGIGFQPEIVLFFCTENTADGVIADANMLVGAAISSSERFAIGFSDEDGVATVDCTRSLWADRCITMQVPGSTSTSRVVADFVSQDADGFTINLSDVTGGVAYRVGYLALAGTDLTNVKIGTFAPSGSTGNQAVTGVGFQPDAAMFFGYGDTIGADDTDTSFGMGWAVSTSERAWISTANDNSDTNASVTRAQRTDSCFGYIHYTDEAVDAQADFVSWDADGFTLTWDNAAPAADTVVYIAFKGGQYYAGSLTTQTSTGEFSETGVGFQGSAGIFASFCNPASGGLITAGNVSLGVAVSSTERFTAGFHNEDNVATMNTDQSQNDGLMYENYDYSQTVEGAIDFVSWGADGFTLDQTDADPTAGNEIIYLIFGAEAGGTLFFQSVAGTSTTAGAITKQTGKPLAGTLTTAGAVIKQAIKSFAGTLTTAGSAIKRTSKSFAGSLTPSGVLATAKTALLSLAGTLTTAGTITKQSVKSFAGTLTTTGDVIKQTAKSFVGTLTSSGILSSVKTTLVSLAGTLTTAGAITKRTGKTLAGTLTTAGTITKQTAKSFAGTLTTVGTAVGAKLIDAVAIISLTVRPRSFVLTVKSRAFNLTTRARSFGLTVKSRVFSLTAKVRSFALTVKNRS